jgi:23S rRNA A2030 N6-methylase RlmJ
MPKLFCVELGIRQRKNLCRMTSSVLIMAKTPADAVEYVTRRCPRLLRRATVQRVFETGHVVVDWPTGDVAIVEL